ncbi:MAG: hypothetical protein BWZ07_03093 [Alphaproteobacteria bacterium ADurb.BinA280]|jgi:hypothetical protein|uniref:hypothetical protein n=1 Tax=Casimicrobium huifangae TaxID=2591109 RepID=UPI0009C78EC2|nr:hypothetical protein [Casimicrobium huifangae]OPZ08859.1 MAG: hypothetical protein BWZ07_03093 [Alphaproteobacteria bacterium ADurb.BinA280]HOB01509.1 hypothetical protein [Casimicrobium huifangae]HQA33341.1 hypothetical protein [Casimicrobium huifangae]HQD65255.1 hypothetical protein [Casimicrobium huifangae]
MRWPWTYRRDLYASVDNAVKLTRQWIDVHHVPVRYIETVAAFERWSKHLGVWFFYETDAQRCHGEESDLSNAMRERFLRALKESGYPDAYLPLVSFAFDSHETVLRDYCGSYFNRLR